MPCDWRKNLSCLSEIFLRYVENGLSFAAVRQIALFDDIGASHSVSLVLYFIHPLTIIYTEDKK